jgi:hypothetical protein
MRDLYLAIDVGTGGPRAALVDRRGTILAIASREHEQIVPRFGWSEQRPADWWAGTMEAIREVLTRIENAPARVAAICACGQMHGTVLIDDDGQLAREAAPLWNDKRTLADVEDFAARHDARDYLARAANPPSPAWPAFKLRWIAAHDPEAMAVARTVPMPKDWINFKLTGIRAQDRSEASMSFLMDAATRDWSEELLALTGVRRDPLPELRDPREILGGSSEGGALGSGRHADRQRARPRRGLRRGAARARPERAAGFLRRPARRERGPGARRAGRRDRDRDRPRRLARGEGGALPRGGRHLAASRGGPGRGAPPRGRGSGGGVELDARRGRARSRQHGSHQSMNLRRLHAEAGAPGIDQGRIVPRREGAGGGHAAVLAPAARDGGEVSAPFQADIRSSGIFLNAAMHRASKSARSGGASNMRAGSRDHRRRCQRMGEGRRVDEPGELRKAGRILGRECPCRT